MEKKEFNWDYMEKELDVIIQGARHEALQNIKEKLALDFETSLWKQVEKRLEYSSLNNDRPIPNDQTFVQVNKGNEKIYHFGVTWAEAQPYIKQSKLEGMVNEDRVYTLRFKDLVAVVCQVPEEEFNEFKIQELIENPDWLEEKAERHRKVVSFLAKKYPIIPMGFPSLYPAQHQLELFMGENYSDLTALLNKIQNKNEWALKMFLNVDSFKKFLLENDESINSLMDETLLNQGGKGYLPQKRLENRIERKAFDLAEEVHRRLCRFSHSAVLNKLVKKDEAGKRGQMILNGAYLVERSQVEEFLQVVKLLDEVEGPRGFVFKISGPRPCYNFCHISSTCT